MSGIPGLVPVESAAAGGGAEPINLTQVGGVATGAGSLAVTSIPGIYSSSWQSIVTLAPGTTATTIKAGVASQYVGIIAGILTWDTLTAGVLVNIRDGAAGTVIWQAKLPAGAASTLGVLLPGPIFSATAGNLLEILTTTSSTVGNVYLSATGCMYQ